jgi:DNA-binding XRE family transcriptional regulator
MSMPRKALPRIESVEPGRKPITLQIRWNTGDDTLIDVSGIVNSFRAYAPLRQSTELFRRVRVGEFGTDVVWDRDLDMSNDTLWRLAQEQSGATMNAEGFRRWRAERGYTLEAAARALGVSRRMIAYYEKGERPIPRVVALATRALVAAQ